MHHNLKSFGSIFQSVVDKKKCSEVRFNDRGYQIGDTITLHEGQPGLNGFEYTGRTVSARISFIDDFGLNAGYVNLSIADVGLLIIYQD